MRTESPTSIVWAPIVPTGVGGRLGTVIWKDWVAESPPGSLAVTVTVVLPLICARTVTVEPETVTRATAASDELAP